MEISLKYSFIFVAILFLLIITAGIISGVFIKNTLLSIPWWIYAGVIILLLYNMKGRN